MKDKLPSIIFITGTDGAGKSCIASWLTEQLRLHDLNVGLVWSRFNNFLSKPFLAATRLSGHNYYKTFNGIKFGYHNFENLGLLRHLFIILQAIDVNIGAYRDITRVKKKFDVIVCERGPWDTLGDVIADTNINIPPLSTLGKFYATQVRSDSKVILIKRSKNNILASRPELINDYKLDRKINIYLKFAEVCDWHVIDNNNSLAKTQKQISNFLNFPIQQ